MSTCYTAAAKQAATLFDDEPKGEKQVLQHPESEAILASKAKEINSFYDMQVMKTVPMSTLPPGATILPSHLIYKRKYKIDEKTKQNVFDKWKTRLVIGGNRQKEHDNAFAPTPSWSSIRMALAYTASKDWKVVSYDLASAFCRTPLQGRAIYVRPPPGLVPPATAGSSFTRSMVSLKPALTTRLFEIKSSLPSNISTMDIPSDSLNRKPTPVCLSCQLPTLLPSLSSSPTSTILFSATRLNTLRTRL